MLTDRRCAEQDRASPLFVHHRELAGPAPDQLPYHRESHRRNNDQDRTYRQGALGSENIQARSQGVPERAGGAQSQAHEFHGKWNYAITPQRCPGGLLKLLFHSPLLTSQCGTGAERRAEEIANRGPGNTSPYRGGHAVGGMGARGVRSGGPCRQAPQSPAGRRPPSTWHNPRSPRSTRPAGNGPAHRPPTGCLTTPGQARTRSWRPMSKRPQSARPAVVDRCW